LGCRSGGKVPVTEMLGSRRVEVISSLLHRWSKIAPVNESEVVRRRNNSA
jgi:transposase-like protein